MLLSVSPKLCLRILGRHSSHPSLTRKSLARIRTTLGESFYLRFLEVVVEKKKQHGWAPKDRIDIKDCSFNILQMATIKAKMAINCSFNCC